MRERQPRTRAPLVLALAVATLVAFALDLVAILGSGPPDPLYLGLSLSIGLGVAALAGAAALLVGASTELALGLWTAGQLLPRTLAWGPAGWLLAPVLAGLTTVILVRVGRRRIGPVALGSLVGFASVTALVGGPQALHSLVSARVSGLAQGLVVIGGYAVLLVLGAWAASRGLWVRRLGYAEMVAAGALLVWVGAAVAESRRDSALTAPIPPRDLSPPSILLLVLDTVRADALSLYGYDRATTPRLDQWVRDRDAVVVPSAYAPSSWSAPSHASLLTGRLPSEHGIHGARPRGFIDADRTLAEIAREHGYETGAIVANMRLAAVRDLRRGFDHFELPPATRPLYLVGEAYRRRWAPGLMADRVLPYPSARAINRRVVSFLDRAGENPVFLLANYMEAHAPYAAPEPFRGRFSSGTHWRRPVRTELSLSAAELERTRDAYDEEIAALDDAVVELLEVLESSGWLDSAWVVITSDHGESFGEHGVIEHGSSVFEHQVRVPLVLVPPGGSGVARPGRPVSLLDLSATLAAILGSPGFGRGSSLLAGDPERPAPFEFFGNWTRDDRRGAGSDQPASGVVADRFKVLLRSAGAELYDLERDAAEASDLAAAHPDLLAELLPLVPPLPDPQAVAPDDGGPQRLSPAQQEALRSLGYIDD